MGLGLARETGSVPGQSKVIDAAAATRVTGPAKYHSHRSTCTYRPASLYSRSGRCIQIILPRSQASDTSQIPDQRQFSHCWPATLPRSEATSASHVAPPTCPLRLESWHLVLPCTPKLPHSRPITEATPLPEPSSSVLRGRWSTKNRPMPMGWHPTAVSRRWSQRRPAGSTRVSNDHCSDDYSTVFSELCEYASHSVVIHEQGVKV
jgi:hypothetical protein